LKVIIKPAIISVLMLMLLACNATQPSNRDSREEIPNVIDELQPLTTSNSPDPSPTPIFIVTSTPAPTDTPMESVETTMPTPTTIIPLEEREPLKDNEFYPDLLQVGDQVTGLTVDYIEYDTLDIPSYSINFNGELILEGEVKHIDPLEKGEELHSVYFTVSEESLMDFPRRKSANMNYLEVVGITNGFEVLDQPGTKKIVAKFRNLTLNISPTKPVDHTIELVEVLE